MRSLLDDLAGKTSPSPKPASPTGTPAPAKTATQSQSLQDILSPKTTQQRAVELEKQAAELLRQARAARTSEFEKFGHRYWSDPVGFIKDCVKWKKGEGLTPYQEEILGAIVEKRRVCVRGAHGLGKSCLASHLILWFALTREAVGVDYKGIITASVSTQLRSFLWPEVKKWSGRLRWDKIGRGPFNAKSEMLTLELILPNGRIVCVSPEDPQKAEGAHATELLLLCDESKAIPNELFDALEGAFSGAGADTGMNAYMLMVSTPGTKIGRFYEVQHDRERFKAWWVRHVRTEEILAAGRMSQEFMNQKALEWGVESSVYISRVLGEFANVDDSCLIPLAWVEAAFDRWETLQGASGAAVS